MNRLTFLKTTALGAIACAVSLKSKNRVVAGIDWGAGESRSVAFAMPPDGTFFRGDRYVVRFMDIKLPACHA